jgi:uncharacterized protein YllA (UPF0747 family)
VILRGIYQESILPDIAFIGGGGEIAYWLQFKELFDHYKIAFPILVLRNSFTVIERKWEERIQKLNLALADIFKDAEELFNEKVERQSTSPLKLNGKIEALSGLYMSIKDQASSVDPTLQVHVQALESRPSINCKSWKVKC